MIIERRDQDAWFHDDSLTPALVDTMPVNDLLLHLFNHVQHTFMHEMFDTKALYYPQLDSILSRLSQRLYADAAGWAPGNGVQLIIGSQFSKVGGHSRVAKGFADLDARSLVVVTDPFDQQTAEQQREMCDFFAPTPVLFIPRGNLAQKVDWLRTLILGLRPDHVSCFNHHADPVPIAATAAAPVPRRTYCHHCDYRPSLGATLPDYLHVDLTEELATLCRHRSGAGHVRMLALFDAAIPDVRALPAWMPGRPVSTVSAGGASKYSFLPAFSVMSYPHVLPLLMAASGGAHHHIGSLPDGHLAAIRAQLMAAGIDPARFVYHGNVPSVAAVMRSIENPVYLPSFPVGGAMMIVEVMSVGVPVLLNANPSFTDAYDFTSAAHRSLMPALHAEFTDVAQIAPALAALAENYAAYAASSRERFEHCHSAASFDANLHRLYGNGGHGADGHAPQVQSAAGEAGAGPASRSR